MKPSVIFSSLALAASTFVANGATAFECTPAATGGPTQGWNQRCIPYYISRNGDLLAGAERRQLIKESFEQWSYVMNSCTDLEFIDAGYTDELARFDEEKRSTNINVIGVIDNRADLDYFGQTGLLAITLTSFSKLTGEIFDADILINDVDHDFIDITDPTRCSGVYDIRNMLVHEMGHFIGFDHEDAEADSTMRATADHCETVKRDLSTQDRRGVCQVYAAGEDTNTCRPPANGYEADSNAEDFAGQCERLNDTSGCGCTAASPSGTTSPFWMLLALVMLRRLSGR